MSNANVPQTLFHIFFLPSICQPNSTQLNSAQLSSCNSAQLSSANYLVAQLSSANYLVAQVGSARPTRNGQFLTHLEVARPDSHSLHACRSHLRISLDSHMHAAEGPTCCNHPLKHKFAGCSPPRPTFGACSLFSTVTLDRDTCTQRPTCSQQPTQVHVSMATGTAPCAQL